MDIIVALTDGPVRMFKNTKLREGSETGANELTSASCNKQLLITLNHTSFMACFDKQSNYRGYPTLYLLKPQLKKRSIRKIDIFR